LKATAKISALLFIDKLYVLTVVYLDEMFYITGKQEVTPPLHTNYHYPKGVFI